MALFWELNYSSKNEHIQVRYRCKVHQRAINLWQRVWNIKFFFFEFLKANCFCFLEEASNATLILFTRLLSSPGGDSGEGCLQAKRVIKVVQLHGTKVNNSPVAKSAVVSPRCGDGGGSFFHPNAFREGWLWGTHTGASIFFGWETNTFSLSWLTGQVIPNWSQSQDDWQMLCEKIARRNVIQLNN